MRQRRKRVRIGFSVVSSDAFVIGHSNIEDCPPEFLFLPIFGNFFFDGFCDSTFHLKNGKKNKFLSSPNKVTLKCQVGKNLVIEIQMGSHHRQMAILVPDDKLDCFV